MIDEGVVIAFGERTARSDGLAQMRKLRAPHSGLHVRHAKIEGRLLEGFEHDPLAVVLNRAGNGHGVLA